jgi:hypothetical protein
MGNSGHSVYQFLMCSLLHLVQHDVKPKPRP